VILSPHIQRVFMTLRHLRASEKYFCLLVTSCLFVTLSQGASRPSIGVPSAVAGRAQDTLTVTSVISGAEVIDGSVQLQRVTASGRVAVVGLMGDDGRDGDAIAGDNVWTLRSAIETDTAGPMTFRVSAAIRGSIRRLTSATALIDVSASQTRASSVHSQALSKVAIALRPAAVAGTTLLDYEIFGDNTALTNQYSGITFSNAVVFESGISLNEFEFPPHSGTNVVSDNGGAITITFAAPVASFSGFFTYRVPVNVTAYNSSNTIVATSNSHFTNNLGLSGAAGTSTNDAIQVASANGISKVTITGDAAGSSFTMDDTVLGAPVTTPPPSGGGGGTPLPPPAPPSLSVGTLNLGTIAAGASISGSLNASGGTPPYRFAALGPLPAGVTLTADGKIGGKPTQPGTTSFSVTVTDNSGVTAGGVVLFSVLAITTTSLPDATAFADYSATVAVTGGSGSYSFTATGLPPGASLGSGGVLRGPITKEGTYSISVQASDGSVTVTATLGLKVNPPAALKVTSATLPAGTISSRYSQSLSATGGAAPYSWVVTDGSLPAGLSLSSTGVISGFPLAAGTSAFKVTATDSTGGTASGQFSIAIAAAPLALHAPAVLSSGMVGVEYPVQLVTASGGNAPYTFSLNSGSLPTGLTLGADGTIRGTPATAVSGMSFTVKATDAAGATGTATLTVSIRAKAIDLLLSGGSLAFSLSSGSGAIPTSQAIQVQSSNAASIVAFSAAVTPSVPWLSVSGGTSTPAVVNVSLTSQALTLAASTTPYQAAIVFTCAPSAPCAGATQTVGVSLTVTTSPAQLSILNNSLAFTGSSAAPQSSTQSLNLQNVGGGSVGIISIQGGAGWLQVGTFPASVPAGPVASVPVTADPTGLAAGFYRTTVTVASSGGTSIVPATLLVGTGANMALAPAGVQVVMPAGGAPPPLDNSIPVTVSGSGAVAWTASVLPGASWLTVTTPGGTSTSDAPAAAAFALDSTAAGALAAGTYYGTIRVTSNAVLNSPQDFAVVLTVAPATGSAVPNPSPQGLLFISGGGTLPPQTVQVSSGGAGSVSFQASASTTDGRTWLSVTPATGTATAAAPAPTTVTANPTGLAAGTYYGSVSYAGAGAAVRSVSVTLLVPSGGASDAKDAVSGLRPAAAGCAASQIAVARIVPVGGFSYAAGLPAPISLRLADNCGNAVVNGRVVASFSNGDSPVTLQLANATSGLYSGTWTPRQAALQATISAAVTAPGLPAATTEFKGTITPGTAPVLTPLGTLHVFSPQIGGALAPGTIVQIYGSNFATQTVAASTLPLPTTLAGTSVIIGGILAPLYYVSPGQINAQAPFELAANHQYQVVINSGGVLSTPDSIQTVAEAPGFAALASGAVIAIHGDGSLVSASAPAAPGEYLTIFGAGLGATDNVVATGAATPASPLSRVLSPPTLTIDAQPVPVLFAGLTPSLVGLYQINFQVPADAANGSLALQVTQDGVPANSAVLIVHN
jgi:uncharacterized protein (TIGR03437 family)